MSAIESTPTSKSSSVYPLIDTHTHFDAPVFDHDRECQAQQAYTRGVRHLVLVGYLYQHFERLYDIQQMLLSFKSVDANTLPATSDGCGFNPSLQAHIALGLHPFYIEQHTKEQLEIMAQMLEKRRPLAIGEIGLDTYTDAMKRPEVFAKQQQFFIAQLDMAVARQLPVMLHIRKAHAEALALLKAHDYNAQRQGGIAHSFSGGVQEAKAFVKLGFKLGVTGQITNPNAKKLRRAIHAAVDEYGIECLVIETDCPDMTPIMCQSDQLKDNQLEVEQGADNEWQRADSHNRNVPANLPWVLSTLSELSDIDSDTLAHQLWQNSCTALQTSWIYPSL